MGAAVLPEERRTMRPWLKWSLAASTVASAIALVFPTVSDQVNDDLSSGVPKLGPSTTEIAVPLPSALPVQELWPNGRDLFASKAPQNVAPAQQSSIIAPTPEPPRPPSMTYRYLGSFTGPDGLREIYITKTDRSLAVRDGSQLEGGFVVSAISETAIHLVHTASMAKFDIPIAQRRELP